MRYQVDLPYGSASYDERDTDRAWDLFQEEGIRIRRCRDIFDEGTVIAGSPIVQDLTLRPWEAN
jgi:hypothetical protein